MYEANANRYTASYIVERALEIADIANTDFLSYKEKTKYLNDAWKNVYQTLINYNLDIFTVRAQLIGSGGVYPLPWDCYQIKAVKNPISGNIIPRKAESESIYGPYYEIVNNKIVLGPTVGPVEIIYWRKPFFLSLPNTVVETQYDRTKYDVLSTCNNSLLIKDNAVGVEVKMYIQNLLADSTLELPMSPDPAYTWYLGNNFVLKYKATDNGDETWTTELVAYDFYGNIINQSSSTGANPIDIIRADSGMLYEGHLGTDEYADKYYILDLFGSDAIKEMDIPADLPQGAGVVGIDSDFYFAVDANAFPIGVFDDRPAYIMGNKTLHLINPDGSEIVEKIDVPSIGAIYNVKYGYLTFDGKLYSCIPDTELNFPNNLMYDLISYDLAVRFLCKQNADSSGVENQNRNAWNAFIAGIDMSSDFQRIKLVRRR